LGEVVGEHLEVLAAGERVEGTLRGMFAAGETVPEVLAAGERVEDTLRGIFATGKTVPEVLAAVGLCDKCKPQNSAPGLTLRRHCSPVLQIPWHLIA
jgi:hypothetical protein